MAADSVAAGLVRRLVTAVAVAVALSLAGGESGAAAEVPHCGAAWFPAIRSPESPEEYACEVELGERQELRQVDDQHVAVVYSDGYPAFQFTVHGRARQRR